MIKGLRGASIWSETLDNLLPFNGIERRTGLDGDDLIGLDGLHEMAVEAGLLRPAPVFRLPPSG